MKYVISDLLYNSRRGKYRLVDLPNNPIIWKPSFSGSTTRDLMVIDEVKAAFNNTLNKHPYWNNEPQQFIDEYTSFYVEVFDLKWLNNLEDRHNIVVNKKCCLSLIQYNNGVLTAYSRSTDMRNGYFSDKQVLEYLAYTINKLRPDCPVNTIVWYLAIPHVYEAKGIARLENK